MTTKVKKTARSSNTGVRYSDSQKTEIVEFVKAYNATNGRGGQSAAAARFNVTPLTISGWLKSAGVNGAGRKSAKPKAAKKAKAGGRNSNKGMRYSPEYKQEVVEFVRDYNSNHGRGGQNQAANKFNLSVLTVSSWLKAAGVKNPARGGRNATRAKSGKAANSSKDLAAFKAELLKLIKRF